MSKKTIGAGAAMADPAHSAIATASAKPELRMFEPTSPIRGSGYVVDRLDPMPHGDWRGLGQVHPAADVAGADRGRRRLGQRRELVGAQGVRERRLGQRLGAGRAAAEVGVADGLRIVA